MKVSLLFSQPILLCNKHYNPSVSSLSCLQFEPSETNILLYALTAERRIMATPSKTRVCVKNLPPAATERDVKEYFQETASIQLEISDCRVLRNAKGKSRKVAFLGFRKEDQAAYVVEQFHRTFMGMSRLSVEPALAKKEEPAKEAEPTMEKEQTLSKGKGTEKESRHKKEILELFGAGQKSKFWANDEEAPALEPEQDEEEANQEENDKKYVEASKKMAANVDSSSSSSDSDESSDSDNENEAEADAETSEPKSGLSDLDFLRSKQRGTDDLENETPAVPSFEGREQDINTDSESGEDGSSSSSSSDDSSATDDEADEPTVPQDAEVSKATKETAANVNEDSEMEGEDDDANDQEVVKKEELSKSRLFVRNMPFDTTEVELEEYFSAYGALVECHIPVDDQKRNKGFAFVQYANAVDALEARKQLDKVDFQGRLLHILPAKPAPKQSGNEHLTWKQKQELARKEQDTKNADSKGWSASFVRGDAVVDNLAERLGLRKADFLGVKDKLSSGDAAVRLALGETQIIEENREYFRENGIDMEALVSANGKEAERSKTSILVKNLPFDTRVEELAKLFQMGDETVKILLPPSRTIALIEYGHHSDAKKAFKRLAYRRFKHVPIYLEWAPLASKTNATENSETNTSTTLSAPNAKDAVGDSMEDVDADGFDGAISTIYVKNLNFKTAEETLRQVFEKNVGMVRSVRIPQKVAPAKSGEEPQLLSMGYGFVELESEASARKAVQMLQGKLVEGHNWEVTISSNSQKSTGKSKLTPPSKNPTKLIVRNVPFQANRSEILKLFGSFGQLRRVRLPKKFDGSHRGFAFVEFLTSKEAVAAMNALSRTHLYGRHLVLEWATEDDQDVDKLREKAKRDTEVQIPKNKRIKFT